MNPNPLYKTYKNNEIDGAQPAEQIAILLEKAAEHTKKAKSALQDKDMENCYFYCEKVRTIVNGLAKCLSYESAEQEIMATTLRNYYEMLEKLVSQIISHQDLSSCDALIDSLYEIAATWRQIANASTPQGELTQESQSMKDEGLNFSA